MKKLVALLCLAVPLLAGCGGGDEGDEFCELAKQYEADFEDSGDATDAGAIEKELQELTAAIDDLADEAPEEIDEDTKTLAAAFDEYDDLLSKYDYDFAKVPEAEIREIRIQSPDVQAASERLESYFEKDCGMDADGDGDTDGVIEGNGPTEDSTVPEASTVPEEELDESTEDEQAPADETEATTGQ